jgi:hypothetical protein
LGIVWKYPAILTDEEVGEQATSVLVTQAMLNVIDREETNCQRYLLFFQSNQWMMILNELTDENGKQ